MKKQYIQYGILVVLIGLGGFFFFTTRQTSLEARIEQANELGKQWLYNNVQDNGLFFYAGDPATEEISTGNNAIRQLMASRVLAQESSKDVDLESLHRHNLDFLFEFWYKENGDIGYVYYDEKSKLGANAMLLRTLVYSPFFEEYETEAVKLAEGILHLQDDETGAFRPWYVEPWYTYDADYLLTFYSGEALLALVEYYQKTGNEAILAAAKLSADYYIDRYVTHLEEHYYPAYVPWHTIALNKLYKVTGDETYADAIFVLNDKLLEIQDTSEGLTGRFYNPETPEYGTPHTSSDAVYTEGLAYAYEVAQLVGDKEREATYLQAIELAVENLEWLQYQEEVSQFTVPKERYVGALRTRADRFGIRVDTTQHAVDAFTKLLEVL